MAREEPDGMVGVIEVAVLAIRTPVDQHRETTRRIGAHHVSGKVGAVTHGHHDVGLAYDLVLGSLGSHQGTSGGGLAIVPGVD